MTLPPFVERAFDIEELENVGVGSKDDGLLSVAEIAPGCGRESDGCLFSLQSSRAKVVDVKGFARVDAGKINRKGSDYCKKEKLQSIV